MSVQWAASQQVFAAWVSAGAAIVQAVGAIAAIIVSIQLARSSARREKEADAAAERRIVAAEQAAEARIARSKVEGHNSLIERITALGVLATDEAKSLISDQRASYAANTGTVIGDLSGVRLTELRNALPDIKLATSDVELLEAINGLHDTLAPDRVEAEGGAAYAAALEAKFDEIHDSLMAIDGLRK